MAAFLAIGHEWREPGEQLVRIGVGYPVRLTRDYAEGFIEMDLPVDDARRVSEAIRQRGCAVATAHDGIPNGEAIAITASPAAAGVRLAFSGREAVLVVMRPAEADQFATAIDAAVRLLTEPTAWWSFAEREGITERRAS